MDIVIQSGSNNYFRVKYYEEKTVVRPTYLYNGNPYIG